VFAALFEHIRVMEKPFTLRLIVLSFSSMLALPLDGEWCVIVV
jgi:hypothetical protein